MICFVFPPRFSGAAIQAVALSNRLAKHGVECEFLVPNYIDGAIYKKSKEGRLSIHRVKGGNWGFAFATLIFLLLRRRHYHTLHFHGFFSGHFLSVYLARFFRLRIIQKLTKGDENYNEIYTRGFFAAFRKRALFLIDDYVAISSALYRVLLKFGIPQSRINYIPNGVDVDVFRCDRKRNTKYLREELCLPQDVFVVLCVGVIDERKNNLYILRSMLHSFQIRAAAKKHVKLVFAGPFHNAEYSRKVIEYTRKSGLNDNVDFMGQIMQERLAMLYSASDLCVFAGTKEGLPNVLLEAKSAGLPIVAFTTSGVEDIVRDGTDGFLVPFGNVDAFAEKVLLLMEDSELRKSFSFQAIKDCLNRYDFKTITARYISEIYYPKLIVGCL